MTTNANDTTSGSATGAESVWAGFRVALLGIERFRGARFRIARFRIARSRPARLGVVALALFIVVGLIASACGDPQVPLAVSSSNNALVTATPIPAPPTPTPTATPTPLPTPELGERAEPTPLPVVQPGLSGNTVRIAVIADVETGGTADGLFRDTWSATSAWAMSVNRSGGLNDREVDAVTLNSALFHHRQQLEAVCQGDFFALVGGQSLSDYDGAELLGTEFCDIADFPSDVHGARRAESPNTFIPNPIYNDVRQAGPIRWLGEQFPDATENVAMFWFGDRLQPLRNETERLREMILGEGLTVGLIDTDLEEGPSERVLTRFQEFDSKAIVWNADPVRLTELLAEFAANDIETSWVLCELGCYSQEFVEDGGAAVEGVYAWIPHDPFNSLVAADELITYQYWLKQFAPDLGWSEIGLQAWMAARLFQESFSRLLQAEPEAPTRQQLVSAARSIDNFTAEGILPFINVGAREPTPCFALMVVQNGRWQQVHPQPPSNLDCSADNLYDIVATRNLGLETPPVETSSTNSESTGEDQPISPEDLDNPEDLENPD